MKVELVWIHRFEAQEVAVKMVLVTVIGKVRVVRMVALAMAIARAVLAVVMAAAMAVSSREAVVICYHRGLD